MLARSKRELLAWLDNDALPAAAAFERRVEWLRTLPWWSHVGSFMNRSNFRTRSELVQAPGASRVAGGRQ